MTTRPTTAVDDRPASLGRRFLAVLVDQLVVLLLGGGVALVAVLRVAAAARTGVVPQGGLPAGLVVAGMVLAVVVTVAQWLLHGRYGWTLGRLLLGVRTVDVHSRRPIGAGRVLLRGLVVAAGALVVGVGQYVVLLSPLLDRTGRLRGWHDRAVDAEVLRAASGASARPARPRDATSTALPETAAPLDVPASPVDVPAAPAVAAPPAPAVPSVPSAEGPSTPPATPAGGLVLAPLHPQRSAPDLDTRAIPAVRTDPALSFGLAPELEMTRPARPRTDVVPEPRPGTSTGLRVTFDDGRVITVERLALVGRNPSPAPGVQVVRVVDPSRSVSKTHLQLAVDGAGGAWVVDRGSTNGTLVTLPDGAQVVCPVDHPVRLRVGARVAFGDRSLRVLATPAEVRARA